MIQLSFHVAYILKSTSYRCFDTRRCTKFNRWLRHIEPSTLRTQVTLEVFRWPSPYQEPDDNSQRLYLFQFPKPFPTFIASSTYTIPAEAATTPSTKKVSFAPDVKDEGQSAATPTKEELDGVIGHLEIYRSGARKMRLANGIVLDVCFLHLRNASVDGWKFRLPPLIRCRSLNKRYISMWARVNWLFSVKSTGAI